MVNLYLNINHEKIIRSNQLIDFALAQSDDRRVDFRQAAYKKDAGICGCIMVHYALEVLGNKDSEFIAGYYSFGDAKHILEESIDDVLMLPYNKFKTIKTYGDLKTHLRNEKLID